jgi:hypothetical protein
MAVFLMQVMIGQSDARMPRQRTLDLCSVCARDLAADPER